MCWVPPDVGLAPSAAWRAQAPPPPRTLAPPAQHQPGPPPPRAEHRKKSQGGGRKGGGGGRGGKGWDLRKRSNGWEGGGPSKGSWGQTHIWVRSRALRKCIGLSFQGQTSRPCAQACFYRHFFSCVLRPILQFDKESCVVYCFSRGLGGQQYQMSRTMVCRVLNDDWRLAPSLGF